MKQPPKILTRVRLTKEAQQILAEQGSSPKWLRKPLTVTQVAHSPGGDVYLRLERPFEHVNRYGHRVCELTTAVLVGLEHVEAADA